MLLCDVTYMYYSVIIIIIAPIAQLVSALDLVTSSVQVEGSILTAGKRLSLKKSECNNSGYKLTGLTW